MRKFYIELKNGDGSRRNNVFYRGRINLQLATSVRINSALFFNEPEGLGYDNSFNYSYMGDGFYKNVERKYAQQTISGKLLIYTMYFLNDGETLNNYAYETYEKVFSEIEKADKIYFVYSPYGDTDREYRRLIEVQSVSKTEINLDGNLEIPVSFKCLTPWYSGDSDAIAILSDRDYSMRYTYRYNDELRYGDVVEAYRCVITSTGSLPAGLLVRIRGVKSPKKVLKSPKISLIDSDTGEEIGRCEIGVDLHPLEVIELSSIPSNSYIKKINYDGTEEDLTDYMNVLYDPFIRVPPGKTCEVVVETGINESGVMPDSVEVYAYYFTRVV